MTTATTARRRGFTLIEVLVVIAILGLLAAISTGAYFRIKAGQDVANTEATMSSLNTGLDKRWRAVLDQANQEVKDEKFPEIRALIQALSGNKDLARVVWTYLRIRYEFPTTIREAQAPPPTIAGVTITTQQTRKVFQTPALPAFGTVTATPEEQSAVCLYIALTQTGNRGETFSLDGIQNRVVEVKLDAAGTTAKAFADSWGRPIAFCRLGYNAEVQVTPFTKVTTAYKDPLDPTGAMAKYAAVSMANKAVVDGFWALVNGFHMTVGGTSIVSGTYSSQNWVPTLISGNSDRTFDSGLGTGNDLLSYRLRREGTKAD